MKFSPLSEVSERDSLDLWFINCTVAPGTNAPEGSRTVPVSEPVEAV
jgi:hypothetical protein